MAKKSTKKPLPVWGIKTPAFVGFLALGILVGGLGLWSVKTRLAGAIVSPGVIEVQSNRQVVEHPDGGVVARFSCATVMESPRAICFCGWMTRLCRRNRLL